MCIIKSILASGMFELFSSGKTKPRHYQMLENGHLAATAWALITSAHPSTLQGSHSGGWDWCPLEFSLSLLQSQPSALEAWEAVWVASSGPPCLPPGWGDKTSQSQPFWARARSAVTGEKQSDFTHRHTPPCCHDKNGENWAGEGGG